MWCALTPHPESPNLLYRQLCGTRTPVLVPRMLLHEEVVALFMYIRLMSCSRIPVQGLLLLQSNVTASLVADVPRMFLYVTPLIFTPELCQGECVMIFRR